MALPHKINYKTHKSPFLYLGVHPLQPVPLFSNNIASCRRIESPHRFLLSVHVVD